MSKPIASATPAMRHVLRNTTLSHQIEFDLTPEEACAIRAARSDILMLIEFETLWHCVLSNHLEIEQALANEAILEMTRTRVSYDEYRLVNIEMARRLMNLLTTTRAFIEQSPSLLKRLTSSKESDYSGAFKAASSVAYDGEFSYRLFEGLRNYAQHHSLPVHGSTFNNRWIQDGDQLEHSVSIYLQVDKLMGDTRIKAALKKELAGMTFKKGEIPLVEPVRIYVEKLGGLTKMVREMTKKLKDGAIDQIMAAHQRMADMTDASVFPSIYDVDADGKRSNRTHVSTENGEILNLMIRRNSDATNLRKRIISNRIAPTPFPHEKP